MLLQREQSPDAGTSALSQAGGKRWFETLKRAGDGCHCTQEVPFVRFLDSKGQDANQVDGFHSIPEKQEFHGNVVTKPSHSILLLRDFEKKSQVTFGQFGQVH